MGYLKGAEFLPNGGCGAIGIQMTALKLHLVGFSQQDQATKYLYKNKAPI